MNYRFSNADYASFSRIVITPFTFLILSNWWYSKLLVLGVVLVGIVSDFLDGYWARKYKTTSNFGAFLDFTADKMFVCTILVILSVIGKVPAWMTLVILNREFLVMGMRIYAAIEGLSVPSRAWGKWKTVAIFSAILGILIDRLQLLPFNLEWANYGLLLVGVILSIISAFDYLGHITKYLNNKKTES